MSTTFESETGSDCKLYHRWEIPVYNLSSLYSGYIPFTRMAYGVFATKVFNIELKIQPSLFLLLCIHKRYLMYQDKIFN